MATLVLGYAVGYALSSPVVGMTIGSSLGGIIDRKLFGDKAKISRQPDLQDVQVTSSAYGLVRPVFYGRNRAAGNLIWMSDITNLVVVSTDNGHLHREIGDEIYVSLAFALGDVSGGKIIRTWVNGDTMLDRWAVTALSDRKRIPRRAVDPVSIQGTTDRWYTGLESQEPDALMQAFDGVNATPAYRGTALMVLEDFPISKFGGTIPNFTYEFSDNTTNVGAHVVTDLDPSGCPFAAGGYEMGRFAVDKSAKLAYLQVREPSGTQDETGFRVIDWSLGDSTGEDEALDEVRDVTLEELGITEAFSSDGDMCLVYDGTVIALFGTQASAILRRIDLEVKNVRDSLGTDSAAVNGWDYIGGSWYLPPLQFVVGISSGLIFTNLWRHQYVLGATYQAGMGVVVGLLDVNSWETVWSTERDSFSFDGARVLGVCKTRGSFFTATGYVITGPDYDSGASGSSVYIYSVAVDSRTDVVSIVKLATLTPGDLVSGASTLTAAGRAPIFDEDDTSVMFWVQEGGANGYLVKVSLATGTVVWRTSVFEYMIGAEARPGQHYNSGGKYAFAIGNDSYAIDTSDGSLISDSTYTISIDSGGAQMYHATRELILGVAETPDGVAMLRSDRLSATDPAISDIIADICGRVGVAASDYDVSDLSALTVHGYMVARQSTARIAIEELVTFFQLRVAEIDDQLVFRLPSETSEISIDFEDMVLDESSGIMIDKVRLDGLELPLALTYRFIDPDLDYQMGHQTVKRAEAPTPTMYSKNHHEADFAITVSEDVARQQAEAALSAVWTERYAFRFKLSQEFVGIVPGTVLDYTDESGRVDYMRAVRVGIGDDFQVEIEAVSVAESMSVSTAAGAAGGSVGTGIGTYPALKVFVLDCPLLDDEQEPQDRVYGNLLVFVSRDNANDDEFVSASVFQEGESAKADAWVHRGTCYQESSWGRMYDVANLKLNPPGIAPLYNAMDIPPPTQYGPVITSGTNFIVMTSVIGGPHDTLTDDDEFYAGVNRLIAIHPNGDTELIHYKTAEETPGDNAYLIADLLRGIRGTEQMAMLNGGDALTNRGATILFLDNDVKPVIIQYPATKIGQPIKFKVCAYNQPLEEADEIVVIPQGNSLKPYAPCAIKGSMNQNGDIVLTWERRTRVGGAMRDGTPDAPLFEDAEKYEIEIYKRIDDASANYPYGQHTLLRTVRAEEIAGKRYVYTSTQQAEDGFDVRGFAGLWYYRIYVRIYQLSSQAGRGYHQVEQHGENWITRADMAIVRLAPPPPPWER